MKILTAGEMKEVDRRTTVQAGVPVRTLMENAGARVAEFCLRNFPTLSSSRVIVLCGKGNNGGDGLVAARCLRQAGQRPEVWLLAKPAGQAGEAAENLAKWCKLGETVVLVDTAEEWRRRLPSLAGVRLVIDAILGTGLRGPVEGWLGQAIEDVNSLRPSARVVAVDIPSGLSADTGEVSGPAIRADYTVTFTAPKRAHVLAPASDFASQLHVVEIGSPPEIVESASTSAWRWLEPREFRLLSLRRSATSHKGDYGHALIVAGSRGKSGAAVLCGSAALRSGAGLVTVATADSALDAVAVPVPELMTAPLASTDAGAVSQRSLDDGTFDELLKGKTILAMGPGLTTNPETQMFVRRILRACSLPMILDADALNAFAGRTGEVSEHASSRVALTPHPGEMARLAGITTAAVQARRIETAAECARQRNACVVLKGFETVIAAPDGRVWINSTGNPGMATAGSGDVLTGMLAGLVARFGTEAWEHTLAFGVYLHGLAGDVAAHEMGEESTNASDIIRALPQAWREFSGGMQS